MIRRKTKKNSEKNNADKSLGSLRINNKKARELLILFGVTIILTLITFAVCVINGKSSADSPAVLSILTFFAIIEIYFYSQKNLFLGILEKFKGKNESYS